MSAFARHDDVIRAKTMLPSITKRAVYEFLLDVHGGDLPGYGAFTRYCRANGIPFGAAAAHEPHPRFETPSRQAAPVRPEEGPANGERQRRGVRAQRVLRHGGLLEAHKFCYAPTRMLDDLPGCLLETFRFIGGVPRECVTDNISALVTMSGGRRVRSARAWRFAKGLASTCGSARLGAPRPRTRTSRPTGSCAGCSTTTATSSGWRGCSPPSKGSRQGEHLLAPYVRHYARHAVPIVDLGGGPVPTLQLGDGPNLLQRDPPPAQSGRRHGLPLAGCELIYPLDQAFPALRVSHGPHGARQALAMVEIMVDGRLPHLQGEPGLAGGLARTDLPVFPVIVPPAAEGLPVGIPQLRNGVRVRIPELDKCLDGSPSLLQAVHAVLP